MLLRFGTAKKKGLSLADRCHSCEKKEEKQSCQLPAVTSVVQWQIRFGSLPPLFSVLWVFLSQWGCLYICNLN